MRRAATSKPTVWRWQERYLEEGVAGLLRDKTRPSRVPPLPRETRLQVIAKTVQETPPHATHWSRSLMAEAVGISPSSVGRIWAEAGLKPHLTRSFKVSNDPMFEEKVTEIVGLYLDPPERAVVLCVDEKSQIQALDRTQPGLPLKKGRAATVTHDYKRHGTTTLFAALDVKSGMVIGECMPRHRAKEFLTFLRRIDRAVSKPRDIHIVLDNYATHKTPKVQAWLAKQPSIPHLTRSALHRCLQRHGISRLPEIGGDKPKRQRFKRYPIGFFHMDIAEVQTAEGKLYLFVAIDRTSKFAVTQLVEKADRKTAWEFLEHLLEAVPYRIHTILTDNGIQFAEQPRNRNTAYSRPMRFDMICEANGIEHRLTKPNHPWTNGQVERMNRTIKEATVKRFHYDTHDQLRTHLMDFMAAYNFARRLKTLSGLTPYEYICKVWTSEPDRFIVDPIHQMPGLNT